MKIAYLAPEIPALSATFVYNEILSLEKLGVEISSFSIHRPHNPATDPKLKTLHESTIYLYEKGLLTSLLTFIKLCFVRPSNLWRAIRYLVSDVRALGILNRNSAGQCMRFLYSATFATYLIQRGSKHLHIHFAHVPTDVGMYASVIAGIGFSVTAHANDLFERGYLLKQKALRSAFFGTISQYNIDMLASAGLPPSKLVITRCGVDPIQFAPVAINSENHTTVIGTIGRVVEKKGFDTLIRAAVNLSKSDLNFQVLIAGSGPLIEELKILATTLGVSDRITFLGPIAHSNVNKFLSRLNLFILPCKIDAQGDKDGIPVVLMEAMLTGIPVISTRISGIPELVVPDKTGIIVEPDAPAALSNAIEELIANPLQQTQLKQRAIEHVRAEFSLHKNAQKLLERFNSVITSYD